MTIEEIRAKIFPMEYIKALRKKDNEENPAGFRLKWFVALKCGIDWPKRLRTVSAEEQVLIVLQMHFYELTAVHDVLVAKARTNLARRRESLPRPSMLEVLKLEWKDWVKELETDVAKMQEALSRPAYNASAFETWVSTIVRWTTVILSTVAAALGLPGEGKEDSGSAQASSSA